MKTKRNEDEKEKEGALLVNESKIFQVMKMYMGGMWRMKNMAFRDGKSGPKGDNRKKWKIAGQRNR